MTTPTETEKITKTTPTAEGAEPAPLEKGIVSYADYKALEQSYIEERRKMEDRMWLDMNLSRVDEVLRVSFDTPLKKFAEDVINYLARLAGAVHGAFFVVDEEAKRVRAIAGYATTPETMDRVEFSIGEGLVGQVVKSKELLCLDDVETQVNSSLGRITASFFLITPLVFNETVYGVMEMTTLSKLKPRYLILIERASRNIAAALQSILTHQKTKKLLEESLSQYEEFNSQREQLARKDEEMQALKAALQTREAELRQLLEDQAPAARAQAASQQAAPDREAIQQLQDQIAEIRDALHTAQTEIAAKDEALNRAWDKIRDLQALNAQQIAPEGSQILGEELEKLRQEWQNARQQAAQYAEQLQRDRQNMEAAEQEIASLNQRIAALQQEIDARQQAESNSNGWREKLKWKDEEIERLDHQLASQSREIKALSQENIQAQAEIARLQSLLAEKDHLLENTHASNKSSGAEIEFQKQVLVRLQVERDALANSLMEREEFIAQLQLRWERQTRALQQTIREREQAIEALQAELDALKHSPTIANNPQAEALIEQLQVKWQRQTKALLQTIRAQAAHIAELQAAQEAADNALLVEQQKLITDLEAQISQYAQDLNAAQAEITAQKAHVEQVQSAYHELNVRINELQYAIAQAQAEAKEHTAEIELLRAKLQKKEDELLVSNYLLNQMQSNPLASQEIEKMQHILAQKELEIADLRQKLTEQPTATQVEDLVAELQQQLALREQELEALKTEISQTATQHQEISTLVAEIRAKEAQLAAAEMRVAEMERTLKEISTTTTNEPLIEGLTELQLRDFHQKIADLEEIQTQLQTRQAELISQAEWLDAQKQALEIEREEFYRETANRQPQDQEIRLLEERLRSQQQQLEARKAEMQIKEREITKIFHKMNSMFPALEVDMQGTILNLNGKMLTMLGIAEQDIIGRDFASLLTDDFRASPEYKMLVESIRLGVAQVSNHVILKGGKNRQIETNLSFIPILGSDDQPYEVVILAGQVFTPLYRDEVALPVEEEAPLADNKPENTTPLAPHTSNLPHEAQQKLLALENSFLILELDLNGKIIHANKQYLLYLGYELEDVLGKSHAAFIDLPDRESPEYRDLRKHLGRGYASQVLRYIGKEGERVRLRSMFSTLFDEDDQPQKVLVLSQFIS